MMTISPRAGRTLASSLMLACGFAGGLTGCETLGPMKPGDVSGTYIMAVGDADMAASALTSPDLGERDTAARDTLTVVALPLQEPVTPHAQIEVSNSVLCPPTCLSVSKDGKYAFVVEYRGMAGPDARTVNDLPIGNKLTAIDMSDPMRPTICATAEVSKEPISVAVHPDGDLVAVVAQQPRQQIVMQPFKDGSFTGEPAAWPLLGLDNDEAKPTSVAWHPAGTALAVTLKDRGEVMFYRFKRGDDGALALAPWGNPVTVGKAPYAGAFSADGKYFIVNDIQSSETDNYNVSAAAGQIVSVRMGDMPGGVDTAEGGPAQHVVISTAQVGVSPIGMAVSSDGRMIVTANMRATPAAQSAPSAPAEGEAVATPAESGTPADPNGQGGSLSMVYLADDGTLTTVGEYPINAIPAGISFDAKDQFVCVTQFRSFDPAAVDGELSFWRVRSPKGGKAPALEQGDFYVGVGKGPHGVLIVR